ncbi:unnamed protein product [Rangifer tarandus platyrhynchus]|uniref:Uncharacterized protein n=1 Tax=Rangifer tarandus platyrhynchus TaxID=3082113 RepID=A0AC59YXA9_RANTA
MGSRGRGEGGVGLPKSSSSDLLFLFRRYRLAELRQNHSEAISSKPLKEATYFYICRVFAFKFHSSNYTRKRNTLNEISKRGVEHVDERSDFRRTWVIRTIPAPPSLKANRIRTVCSVTKVGHIPGPGLSRDPGTVSATE